MEEKTRKNREAMRRYHAAHRKERAEYQRLYLTRPEVKASRRARGAAYRAANGVKVRAAISAWVRANPDKASANQARRRAAKMNATPAWADQGAIRAKYTLAADVTDLTGIEHQVDHIVPLTHPLVCGLHVHENMEVITATANAAKGNRWWPDMPK